MIQNLLSKARIFINLHICGTFYFLENHGVYLGVFVFFRAAPALHTPKKLECSPLHSSNFGAAPPEGKCSLRSVVSKGLQSIIIFCGFFELFRPFFDSFKRKCLVTTCQYRIIKSIITVLISYILHSAVRF